MGYIKDTLKKYIKQNTLRLHMPGHKGKYNPFDNTEIPQTDDLNSALGPYKKAQTLLSRAYMSHKSFFITTGATTGINAMVLYAKLSGRQVIAVRNSHISVINACCMYDVEIDIINNVFDDSMHSYKSPEKAIIDKINLIAKKSVVILTSPDYYGRSLDIGAICAAASKKDVLIFCDEAHGSHFIFSDKLPKSCNLYADIWVNSAHKTLGALTQGAYLHCSDRIDDKILSHVVRAVNTSSPSHLIAMSLEEAVIAALDGKWDVRANECLLLQDKINKLEYIKCMDKKWALDLGYHDKDATRIILDAKNAGGGRKLYKKLYEDHNIQLEMADFRYVTAIMTTYDNKNCDEIFFNALKALDIKKDMKTMPEIPEGGSKQLDITKAYLKNVRHVKFDSSIGKIAAVSVGAYPPGSAFILPGELITSEQIEYIKKIIDEGGTVFGLQGGMISIVNGSAQ